LNSRNNIDPIGKTNFHWNIGRNAQNPKRVFNGYIDEVRIYQQALSEKEIQQLMLNEIE